MLHQAGQQAQHTTKGLFRPLDSSLTLVKMSKENDQYNSIGTSLQVQFNFKS